MQKRRQGIFWIGTIPFQHFTPFPMPGTKWIKGQLERGEGGFLHWQIMVAFSKKKSLSGVRELFGPFHFELTRSPAAGDYVWKEQTRVEGTQFELGKKPIDRANAAEWDKVWDSATKGDLMGIESSLRIQHYRTLRAIASDYCEPIEMERTVYVFWGDTGTGKSRTAWQRGGLDSYPKDPNTKFWCGYRGQEVVIIDEFRGNIHISHMLRWLDRYPVIVEIKGASMVLQAKTFYITSNVSPENWYPDLDEKTKSALLRRLQVTHFMNFEELFQ